MVMMIRCIVDSIEANVETAAASVEEGGEQLRQARRSQVALSFCCLALSDIHFAGKQTFSLSSVDAQCVGGCVSW